MRQWEGSFLLGQLRTFPAPPLKDTSSEKPSLLHSPLSRVYLGPWAALIRALTTECPCVCVCLSVCLSVDEDFSGKGWGPVIPRCPGWLSKHPTNVGMSVGGGIASRSEGLAGGPGVARAGPPPLPLARVQDEALLNPADAKAFGSHVAHSSLPPRLQSDPGPDLGLPTLPLSAGQPGLPLLGLRARCQPRRPPVLSPPTVRGPGSWQVGRDRVPEANSVWSQGNESPHPLRRTQPSGLLLTCPPCSPRWVGASSQPSCVGPHSSQSENRSCNGHRLPGCSSNTAVMVPPGPSAWVSPWPHRVLRAPSLPPDLGSDGADHPIKLQPCHTLPTALPGFIFLPSTCYSLLKSLFVSVFLCLSP